MPYKIIPRYGIGAWLGYLIISVCVHMYAPTMKAMECKFHNVHSIDCDASRVGGTVNVHLI